MKVRAAIVIVLLLAAGGAALYVFGRTQPIVIVERSQPVAETARCETCQGTGYTVCSACGGSGWTTGIETTCSTCQGSGRISTGSLVRRTKPERTLGSSSTPCPACRGTGKTTAARTKCPACGGSGRIACSACFGTGTTEATGRRIARTSRADLSWWERVLSWIGIAPDENAPPQVRPDGSAPLVEHYVRLFETASRQIEPVAWRDVRRAGAAWEVGVRLRIREGGAEREEERIVRIQNREVTHVLPVASSNR